MAEESKAGVRIPQIADLATAIRLYYSRLELMNPDIKLLFPGISASTVAKLKKKAHEVMDEQKIPSYNALAVNTKAAYEAWGLPIKDLEERYQRLVKMGFDMQMDYGRL